MTKLNDLDAILLSGAAKRDSGSLLPVPESVSGAGARLTKAITGLIKHGLAEERETRDKTAARRTEADVAYGVFITDAGNAAIGIAGDNGNGHEGGGKVAPSAQPDTPRVTKASSVLALLGREEGATLADMIAATGWLPHTTRAALTGLRKKGHTLEKSKRGDQTCYRIAGCCQSNANRSPHAALRSLSARA
jgi:hypothetical protein